MASSGNKKAKTDLLVKVRYQNVLPPPPFPPRLLHIDTTPSRYSTYDFLNPLHNEREISTVLDAELGMAIELGKVTSGEYGDGAYWTGERASLWKRGRPPPPDEEDVFLLGDVAASLNSPSSGASTPVAMGERKNPKVSWLRRTEYLSSEAGAGRGVASSTATTNAAMSPKLVLQLEEEISADDRVKSIEDTFAAGTVPLADLKHPIPSKQSLVAVESWTVLPSSDLWSSTLGLLRFGEDPSQALRDEKGEKLIQRTNLNPQVTKALYRCIEFPDEGTRVAFYLPKDDETAMDYDGMRRSGPDPPDIGQSFEFNHVRDYEISATRNLESEYIFSFDDGEEVDQNTMKKRPRGAFYAPVTAATTLRKRRPRPNEDATLYPRTIDEEHWHTMKITVKGEDDLELNDRAERAMFEQELNEVPATFFEQEIQRPIEQKAKEEREQQAKEEAEERKREEKKQAEKAKAASSM